MESLFAKAWSGCSPQHIPSCKGAFHDVASTTVYRGHAGPELFACNTSLLHPRSIGICTLLQQVTRVVGSRTDSCLSGLSDQRKEAGGSFDQRCHLCASLPLSGDPPKELVHGRHDPGFLDRKSTRLNSSHQIISYAVFCLKKKKKQNTFLSL